MLLAGIQFILLYSVSLLYGADNLLPPTDLELKWASTYDSGLADAGYGVTWDGYRNIYVVGYSSSVTGDKDCRVIKYNQSGELKWSVTYGQEITGVLGDTSDQIGYKPVYSGGYLYVVGSSESATSPGWLLKLDANDGSITWVKSTGLLNSKAVIYSGGYLYVNGNKWDGAVDYDVAITKFDTAGNKISDLLVTTSTALEQCVNGFDISVSSLYVGVAYSDLAGADVKVDGMLVKISVVGNKEWAPKFGLLNVDDKIWDVCYTGYIYVSGTTDMAPPNSFLYKYQRNGTQSWLAQNPIPVSPSYNYGMDFDGEGNVFVAGSFGNDLVVKKYKPTNGEIEWTLKYTTDTAITGIDTEVDVSSNIFVVGTKNGSDIFVARYAKRTYYYPVSGFVRNAGNTGIANVSVRISSGNFTQSTMTAGNGYYSFDRIESGDTYLLVPARVG
jgi:outer membrane protein assembly factor BamB